MLCRKFCFAWINGRRNLSRVAPLDVWKIKVNRLKSHCFEICFHRSLGAPLGKNIWQEEISVLSSSILSVPLECAVSDLQLNDTFQEMGRRRSVRSRKHCFATQPPTTTCPLCVSGVSVLHPAHHSGCPLCPAQFQCLMSNAEFRCLSYSADFKHRPLPDSVVSSSSWTSGQSFLGLEVWTRSFLATAFQTSTSGCCQQIFFSSKIEILWFVKELIFLGRWESVSTSVPTVATKRWTFFTWKSTKCNQKVKIFSHGNLQNATKRWNNFHMEIYKRQPKEQKATKRWNNFNLKSTSRVSLLIDLFTTQHVEEHWTVRVSVSCCKILAPKK